MVTDDGLLFIEPASPPAPEPVVDALTRKMAAAFRLATSGVRYRGVHRCRCGANSSNCNYTLPNGERTNSLCVHYLAFHRDEVPQHQLEQVAALTSGEDADPSDLLTPPKPISPERVVYRRGLR